MSQEIVDFFQQLKNLFDVGATITIGEDGFEITGRNYGDDDPDQSPCNRVAYCEISYSADWRWDESLSPPRYADTLTDLMGQIKEDVAAKRWK
jgi:hypothetical protein